MTQDGKMHLPNGLPARFTNGKQEFERLCSYLGIQNRKQRHVLLATRGVMEAIRHKKASVARLQTAERQRQLITAFYEIPERRRDLWRDAVDRRHDDSGDSAWRVPSLEYIALHRYDSEFGSWEVDKASEKESFGEFSEAFSTLADAREWQSPALAAWPRLRREVEEWETLPADRRDVVSLALFAVATILGDFRLLRWSADRVESLADEFAPVLKGQVAEHEAPEKTKDDDLIEEWRQTCDAIAETARRLGADPPDPQHLPDLRAQLDALDGLRESVVAVLERVGTDYLLQSLDERVGALVGEHEVSPIAQCTGQIGAQWRLAYPDDDKLDLEALRDDVERAVRQLQEALENWQRARDAKANLDQELEAVKRRQSSAKSLADRVDAENREVELLDQIAAAHKKIRHSRDHIFAVVAPAGEQFEPAEDYTARLNDGASDGSVEPPDGASDDEDAGNGEVADDTFVETDEASYGDGKAIRDSGETVAVSPEVKKSDDRVTEQGVNDSESEGISKRDDSATGSPAENPVLEAVDKDALASDEAGGAPDDSATMALWRTLGDGRPGIAYGIATILAKQAGSGPLAAYPDIIAASMLAPHVQSADSKVVADIRRIMERIDPNELYRSDWDDDARDAVSLLLISGALRPALLAPMTGAPSLLRRVAMSETLAPVYQLAKVVADHADRLQGVRLDASLLQAKVGDRWQEEFQACAARVRDWSKRAESKHNVFGRADRVWRNLLRGDGLLAELVTLLSDADRAGQERVEEIRKQIGDRKAFNGLVHKYDQTSLKGDPIQGRALKQIWNDVQPAHELSSEWLRLMAAKPGAEDFVGERVDALQGDLDKHGGDAIAALGGAGAASGVRAAAARYAVLVVTDLLHLVDDASRVEKRELEPHVILSRDLLFVTGLDLDADFQPTPADDREFLDVLVDTDAHVDSARTAFNARLDRQDLIGARLAWDLVDAETEGVAYADECRELLIKGFRPEPAELPVEGLRKRFVPGLSKHWGVSLRDLCEHEEFSGRLIWLDGLDALDEDDWLAWKKFLSDYAQASRGVREFERTLFVAVLEGAPPADPPKEDVTLARCDWRGVVDEMDLLFLAYERLGDRAGGPVMRSLLAATVARVAAWDPDMAERLLDEEDETILDPRCMLQSVANEKGWTSETAVAWELGTASGDGAAHAAIASLEHPPREIQRRLWSAQASVLLPEIDVWRRQFVSENGALLASHLQQECNSTVPMDLDVGDLTGLVQRPGFDTDARRHVRRMNNWRNDLAHLKPLPCHAARLLAGGS